MIIPVGVDYEARRYPVVTFTLIGINVVAFILEIIAFANGSGQALFHTLGLVPSEKLFWAWVTNLFVHGGLFHLLGNMVYLYLFGACIEDLLGRGQFVAFYLGGGIVSNFIQVLFSSGAGADLPIIGASGAISGCIGAFLVALPKTQINFRYLFWFYTGEFWLRSWIVISFWFLADILGFVIDLADQSGEGGVAFAAHVGGTLFGAAVFLARRRKEKPEPEPRIIQPKRGLKLHESESDLQPAPDESQNIFLYINSKEVGPYTSANVRQMASLGGLPNDTLFWRDGMEEWRPLAEL